MLWLIRGSAYFISGMTLWQFFRQGDSLVQHGSALALDPVHGMIFGVCAGVSNYTGLDVSLLRIAWVLSCFYKGIGILIYLLAFAVLPVGG